MNIADIEKVANRKRINAEAEKLREKVTRETANIIKLKVSWSNICFNFIVNCSIANSLSSGS